MEEKKLGLKSVISVSVGLVIATSCLVSLGQGAGTIGVTFIFAMVIACLFNMTTIASLSELNALMPNTTGGLAFIRLPGCNIHHRRKIPEVNGTGYILSHKKTKARVLVIANDDENKVFNIGFRTPPYDDSGIPHILEHSVLCGSRKYPVKDPFVELAKGSLNTFLNAMTYSDKTVYPIASCNEKDFENLMDVYLDAVFYPNIYEHTEENNH